MNKISKLFLGVAALGLAACSSDEPAANGGTGEVPAQGDVAYLNVRITSADGASSKAAGEIGDPAEDYIYGDEDENVVKNAHFYFYDAAGNFVTHADSWTKKGDKPNKNVEVIGDNTVILTGLTGKNYPTWVVTILNKPADFTEPTKGSSIESLRAQVLDSWSNGNDEGKFIMTTSSYYGDDNKNTVDGTTDWKYFATLLKPENFKQETPDKEDFNDGERVEIYVERLAVRVQVTVANLSNKSKKLADGRIIYELPVTVAGETNPDLGGNTGATGTAATKVYVEISGWDLNATAKKTNLMKNLEGWDNTTTFGAGKWAIPALGETTSWNHPDYHRSYWGKSWTYGASDAALTGMLNVSDKTWEQLTQKVGDKIFNGTRVYCNENTNEPANITYNKSGIAAEVLATKATSVLLAARACDENGDYLQIVNYLGINFLKDNFIQKVFENAQPKTFYTREELKDVNGNTVYDPNDGTTPLYKYVGIAPDDAEVVAYTDGGTGAVKVALKKDIVAYTLSEPETITITTPIEDEENIGSTTTTVTKYKATEATTQANIKLATATNGASNKAVAYTDGAMYYPIVLEHLHNPTNANAKDAIEGQYGVVRNHCYNLSITKIKTLGNGVFAPETKEEEGTKSEVLDPKEPKDPTYYVESFINVLSWKVVAQEEEI